MCLLKNIKKGLRNMQVLNNIKVVAVSGLARAGKDTFVAIAKKILLANGYSAMRVAFADELKREIERMLTANGFQATVMTDNTEQKTLIRPLLVWWGCQRRYESNGGLYWVKKAEELINLHSSNTIHTDRLVVLVSDVRFPNEVKWVHETFGGEVIHLRKYSVHTSESPVVLPDGTASNKTFHKTYDAPPNEEEKKQDPIVREMSDYQIEWRNLRRVIY